jgi:voltage-gated potassium channel
MINVVLGSNMSKQLKVHEFLSKSLLDDIVMILLAIFSVFLLILETNTNPGASQVRIYDILDIFIALIFLAEWVYRYLVAPNRKQFVKNYWWELLASIPITNSVTQVLRALRVLRVLRIVRLATRLRQVSDFSQTLSKHSYVIQILLVFLSLTFVASLLFDTFERGINPNVHSTWDSFWWGMSTATTVAYGDISPVTTGGRIVALFLALFGLGTLGALTAKIASTFIKEK